MKKLTVIAIGVLAGASVAAAQPIREDSPKAKTYFSKVTRYEAVDLGALEANILANLRSDNYGVIESALAHAAHFRLARPEFDMAEIRQEVIRLASEGPTASIRYKAHLVNQVCCEPDRFETALDGIYATGDEFFVSLGSRLQAML